MTSRPDDLSDASDVGDEHERVTPATAKGDAAGAGPAPTPPSIGVGTLAERIETLFQTMHPRNRGPYTLEEVCTGIKERYGLPISVNYLWMLRTGARSNPTKQVLEAIAGFFQVPVAYFFNDPEADRIAGELELLRAMRDAGVQDIALRAAELPPGSHRVIARLIADMKELLDAEARAPDAPGEARPARAPDEPRPAEGAADRDGEPSA